MILDSVLQTLQGLVQKKEDEVRMLHNKAITARQDYIDAQNTYKDLKTLYDERLEQYQRTDV